MKKLFLVFLAAVMVFCLAACSFGDGGSANKFVDLKDDEVLVVSNGTRFMNHEDKTVTVKSLSYTLAVTYTLHRSSYNNYDSVYYEGYYYYWDTEIQTETQTLGKETVKTTYTYAYLPYGEDENVVVKTVTTTETSYDYDGGWVEKDVDVTITLGGLFPSFTQLETKCPELAAKINTKNTRKYYIDVTTPDNISTAKQTYNAYYYIEEK